MENENIFRNKWGVNTLTHLNIIKETKHCILALAFPFANSTNLCCNLSGGKLLGFQFSKWYYFRTLLIVACIDVNFKLVNCQKSHRFTFVAEHPWMMSGACGSFFFYHLLLYKCLMGTSSSSHFKIF